jgi:hypothetical protein
MVKPLMHVYPQEAAARPGVRAIGRLRDRLLACNAARWPARFARWAEPKAPRGQIKRDGTIMKIVAVTVAVLALGLAGCARDDQAANQDGTANEAWTENAAENDVNMAENEMTAEDVADNALDNAAQSIENAQDAVSDLAANTTNNQ